MICFKALLIFLTILVARSTQVSAKTILILTLLFEMSVMTTMAYIVRPKLIHALLRLKAPLQM